MRILTDPCWKCHPWSSWCRAYLSIQIWPCWKSSSQVWGLQSTFRTILSDTYNVLSVPFPFICYSNYLCTALLDKHCYINEYAIKSRRKLKQALSDMWTKYTITKWTVIPTSIIYIFGQHMELPRSSKIPRNSYINQRKKEREITHHCHSKKTRLKYTFT
jgi:hypothetical protein